MYGAKHFDMHRCHH